MFIEIIKLQPQNLEEVCTLIIVVLQWFVVFLLGHETYGANCKLKRIQRVEQSVFTKIFHSETNSPRCLQKSEFKEKACMKV